MPRYIPIDTSVPLQASLSDLASFHWNANGIVADFVLPDDEAHLLRVSFDRQCIVRILDEMPLSTEQDDTPKGVGKDSFQKPIDLCKGGSCRDPGKNLGSKETADHPISLV